ncbi:MAG: hypothetical protein JOZ87_32630 [Chloroflexi bacterium]|nr:hypothetical protein [Chloroflexota bacterium]
MIARQNEAGAKSRRALIPSVELRGDLRADGRRKRRPSLGTTPSASIDNGAAFCFGDGRTNGMLAGRKETTRKLYRDAYEAFRRFAENAGVDPASEGSERLPPNVVADPRC